MRTRSSFFIVGYGTFLRGAHGRSADDKLLRGSADERAPHPALPASAHMAAPSKKAEYDKYMETSGGKQMLGQAVVGLSKAALADPNVQPAAFLRDFFESGKSSSSVGSAELSEEERQKVAAYMKASGAFDLLTKALVALFDTAERPPNPGVHFQAFFLKEAPPPPEPEAPPPAAAKEKTPSAPEAAAAEPADAAAAEPSAPEAAEAEPAPAPEAAAAEPEAAAAEPEAAAAEAEPAAEAEAAEPEAAAAEAPAPEA